MIKEDIVKCHEVAMGYGAFVSAKKFESKKYAVMVSVGYYDKDTLAVRCYPTRGEQGWLTNFMFALHRWKAPSFAKKGTKVRYHSGYYKAWMGIRDDVIAWAMENRKPNLIVAGGSQGGGLATIVGMDLAYNLGIAYDNVRQCNFFGPKSINKYGKKSIENRIKNSYTVCYGNDLVTKVVPTYQHVGETVRIGPKYEWWKIRLMDHKDAFNREEVRKILDSL